MACPQCVSSIKLDIAQFDWPIAPFPDLKYPLEEYAEENALEEERCLKAAADILDADADCSIAAMVIEPVQAEGGDRHASPAYFRGLRQLALERDVAFIVDEVQTGECGPPLFACGDSV